MGEKAVATISLDLTEQRLGTPQKSGLLTVLPLFGPDGNGEYCAPLSGLKLSRVTGYGSVELSNPSTGGNAVAIVPLHIGYIQDQAQNHALCRSAFISAGQKLMFQDACCIQESQGGYLEGADQWFFILPLHLREEALMLRGRKDYSKLWNGISRFNQALGLPARGHLEQVLGGQRPYLTQYASRFELLEGQTGAMFLLRDQLVGLELAPSAKYFEELWMGLICFCYGSAALHEERRNGSQELETPQPLEGGSLEQLKASLDDSRQLAQSQLSGTLRNMPAEQFQTQEEERFLESSLSTAISTNFAGQIVQRDGRIVYASVFARSEYLASLSA